MIENWEYCSTDYILNPCILSLTIAVNFFAYNILCVVCKLHHTVCCMQVVSESYNCKSRTGQSIACFFNYLHLEILTYTKVYAWTVTIAFVVVTLLNFNV